MKQKNGSIETFFFIYLLKYIICHGLVTEKEFAIHIQEIQVEVLCTIKTAENSHAKFK